MTAHNDGLSDKVKGKVSKLKGEVKDQVGNATGNHSLQFEGKKDKLKGEFQENVGEAKEKLSK
ncbi:CsbD family protein [Paenibacillus mendelii]|uniref:CsbD family protein n=1 Tax=Paenibacillus mendelii TaxID=206163 RepID=A0ABV6JD73_9BACL|nr:CsbD family protein [Paenibacillus mendelii]MCQ6562384.1 CsbD family protein [Paenibacillus mendelii]